MSEILPQAFGADDLDTSSDARAGTARGHGAPRCADRCGATDRVRHDLRVSEHFDAVDVILTKRDGAGWTPGRSTG